MTLWIMPEFDREGSQFWLQGDKHNETPTDKETCPYETPQGRRG